MYTPPFTITNDILQLVAEISEILGALSVSLGSQMPQPMLRKENQIRTIHSSLAIEHNSLTVEQMTAIINGKHVLGAPNEIQEVKNAVQAYQLMLELDAFSEADLLKVHGLMMKDLVNRPGMYRNDSVGVFAGDVCLHMAPPAEYVPTHMQNLFEWVRTTDVHPLISSCVFHYELEFIHPFGDGNGRMGRYWQTLLLSRWKGIFAWLPVETIVKENQQAYYDAIAKSDKMADSSHFVIFMLNCLLTSLRREVTNKVDNKVTNKIANKSDEKVLELIKKDNHITISKICKITGMSESGVKKILASLKSAGFIERRGSNKTGYWEVI